MPKGTKRTIKARLRDEILLLYSPKPRSQVNIWIIIYLVTQFSDTYDQKSISKFGQLNATVIIIGKMKGLLLKFSTRIPVGKTLNASVTFARPVNYFCFLFEDKDEGFCWQRWLLINCIWNSAPKLYWSEQLSYNFIKNVKEAMLVPLWFNIWVSKTSYLSLILRHLNKVNSFIHSTYNTESNSGISTWRDWIGRGATHQL